MDAISYTPAGPVVQSFHLSQAFVRGLMGPVGSSKSSACCIEMFTRACEQQARNGVRRSRWGIVRNTYPELKTTTIKTFQEWFPFAEMKWDSPISAHMMLPLPDKTVVDAEFLFFPLDRPEEVRKLRSLELTGAWINESSEIPKAAFDMLSQRVGRYPPVKHGGPTWRGIIMDTNPPDDDHWYYKLAEETKPEGWDFFKQPGGLTEDHGKYTPNPTAENIPNLDGGYGYYQRQVAGKNKEWIKVFLLGQYGSVQSGKPVYPEYNDDLHCREFNVLPGTLLLGWDYGLTPACAICQVSPRGQFLVVDELVGTDMGIEQFATDVVKPHLALNYPKHAINNVADPSGLSRKDTDETTSFQALAKCGFPAAPAFSNAFTARRDAVAKYLTKLIDGQGGLLVHPRCKMIRKGFNGAYNYRRVQVVGYEKYRDIPDKNEYSHPHDALQYAALYSQTVSTNQDFSKPLKYPKMGIV